MSETYQCQTCGEEYTESCGCDDIVHDKRCDETIKSLKADNAALRKVIEMCRHSLVIAEQLESCGQDNYRHVLNLIEQTLSKGKTE